MKPNSLAIVFVDALPYSKLDHLGLDSTFVSVRMRAGIGYSVNAKAQLFGGYSPDQLGILNEYSLNPIGRKTWRRHLAGLDRFHTISWYIRRLLRKVEGGQIHNIPFAVDGDFFRQGVAAYEDDFHLPTLLDKLQVKFLYSESESKDRDAWVWSRLTRKGSELSSVFIAFPDLDRDLHQGEVVDLGERVARYGEYANELGHSFETVVMLSDHGMIPVDRLLDLWGTARELERLYGDKYFIDATMIRVWTEHTDEWSEALCRLGVRILTRAERASYGVMNPKFGSILGIAEDGVVFSPNFYGRVRGFEPGRLMMHGYHPLSDAQVGILAIKGPRSSEVLSDVVEVTPDEVYMILHSIISSVADEDA